MFTLSLFSLILLAGSFVFTIQSQFREYYPYPSNNFLANGSLYLPPAGHVSNCSITPMPEYAVALSPKTFNETYKTPNPCGEVIQLNYLGQYIVAQLVDMCYSDWCYIDGTDLQLSVAIYKAFGGDPSQGELVDAIGWTYVPKTTQLGPTNSDPPPTPSGLPVQVPPYMPSPLPPLPPRSRMPKTDGESVTEPAAVRRDMPLLGAKNLKNRMVDEEHWMPRKRTVLKAPANERRMVTAPAAARNHLSEYKTEGESAADPAVVRRDVPLPMARASSFRKRTVEEHH